MNVFRGAVSGSPATIVVFGGGLTPPMIYEMSKMSNTPNLCEIRAKDYEEVELVMLGAPVSVNVIQVPDPTGSGASASTSQTQGLEHLAGITGNRVTRLVGDSGSAMTRLAASNSAYYRATFAAEDSERNGMIRPLNVKVNRPDVEVLSRPRVAIPPARSSKPGAKAASPRDMLRVGDVYRDSPLRAAAYISREGSADKARVVIMVEPMEATASLKAAAVGLYDEKGKLIVQATADQESLARTPPMIAAVTKMGTYRMRVAATDAAGRAGAVDSTLDVSLTGDGPLTLSSLVLGVAEEGRFAGRMQFYDEPTAVAYPGNLRCAQGRTVGRTATGGHGRRPARRPRRDADRGRAVRRPARGPRWHSHRRSPSRRPRRPGRRQPRWRTRGSRHPHAPESGKIVSGRSSGAGIRDSGFGRARETEAGFVDPADGRSISRPPAVL